MMPLPPVYIYRVVLDSVNGVSSTRRTAVAALSLQQGEIRQLQFVDDDTLMVLWASGGTSIHLFLYLLPTLLPQPWLYPKYPIDN